jgi:hypothetical protein
MIDAGHHDGGTEEIEGVPPQVNATLGMPERQAVGRRQARVRAITHSPAPSCPGSHPHRPGGRQPTQDVEHGDWRQRRRHRAASVGRIQPWLTGDRAFVTGLPERGGSRHCGKEDREVTIAHPDIPAAYVAAASELDRGADSRSSTPATPARSKSAQSSVVGQADSWRPWP